jgi:hypothetical protein
MKLATALQPEQQLLCNSASVRAFERDHSAAMVKAGSSNSTTLPQQQLMSSNSNASLQGCGCATHKECV